MSRRQELCRKNPSCKELIDFIRYYLGKFYKKLEEYPELFVEVWFYKARHDWLRIQYGEEYEASKTKKCSSRADGEEKQSSNAIKPKAKAKTKRSKENADLEDNNITANQNEKNVNKLSEEYVEDSEDDDEFLVEYYRKRLGDFGGLEDQQAMIFRSGNP